jgi:sugar lactone lactonase YvrE
MDMTIVAACEALLGEGPVWVEREAALYWLDIQTPRIWQWRPGDGETRWWTPPWRISAIAPRAGRGFIAATEAGFALIDPQRSDYRLIDNPEADLPGNRFNDGKLDRAGRFWAGTMDDAEEAATGALYRLDRDLSWNRIASGYRVTNGPAFAPDGRIMYHSDSALQIVYRFLLDESGEPQQRTVFLQFGGDDGYPDGMTVDAEGCLWIAFWDGWSLRRFSPEGEVLHRLPLPVQRPTSCAFGGDGLRRLYITSARIGLSEQALADQPLAGAVFAATPGVGGLPDILFEG